MATETTTTAPASNDHIMGVYRRTPLGFVRGEGVRLHGTDGEVYLDCLAGIAVNALGHSHPKLVGVLKEQGERLWHVSNIFTIPEQAALAQLLTEVTFCDEAFFTNSGTEAIDCAIKTARKYHWANGQPERIDIIGFEGSFHGRTLAAVNASGNQDYLEGFGPPMAGFVHLAFGDMDALRAAITDKTCAVLLEPVQGEGGARSWPPQALTEIRRLCNETGTLLIYDEIQCGLGRTGKLFAYEWAEDAAPDIMTIAKALGGGFPVGACLTTREAGKGMSVGSHGSTYGGNPLAMAVSLASLTELVRPDLAENVNKVTAFFTQQLEGLRSRFPDVVEEIRGKGLLIGIKLKTPNRDFMQHARDNRLLIAGGADNCVRLLPPLIISVDEASEAITRLEKSCEAARAAALEPAKAGA